MLCGVRGIAVVDIHGYYVSVLYLLDRQQSMPKSLVVQPERAGGTVCDAVCNKWKQIRWCKLFGALAGSGNRWEYLTGPPIQDVRVSFLFAQPICRLSSGEHTACKNDHSFAAAVCNGVGELLAECLCFCERSAGMVGIHCLAD